MAKISVIIPVYNTAEYMDQCIESVLAQTFSDIEIILIDDGSTDGISGKKCDEYAERDSRVKVIHKENGGLQSAWIAGTKEATSNYVFYVDSDDWIDTNTLEEYIPYISSSYSDSELIVGNAVIEKGVESYRDGNMLAPGEYTGEVLDDLRLHIQGEEKRPVTVSRCMKLISRKLVLDNIKYCDSKIVMGEDANITIPILCDCRRLVVLEGAYTYHYRLVVNSMSHGYNPKLLDNTLLTNRVFRSILKDKKIGNADLQMDRELVLVLLVVMKNQLRCKEKGTTRRVKDIFLREDIRTKLSSTNVNISDKVNRLIYFTVKHPNLVTISFLKLVIRTFDKMTNG
ncbi:MAG: glycosyltransferase [Butyrivibrio sp.]|nr:glycosyltransferase [Butyrivibrio sp.]